MALSATSNQAEPLLPSVVVFFTHNRHVCTYRGDRFGKLARGQVQMQREEISLALCPLLEVPTQLQIGL